VNTAFAGVDVFSFSIAIDGLYNKSHLEINLIRKLTIAKDLVCVGTTENIGRIVLRLERVATETSRSPRSGNVFTQMESWSETVHFTTHARGVVFDVFVNGKEKVNPEPESAGTFFTSQLPQLKQLVDHEFVRRGTGDSFTKEASLSNYSEFMEWFRQKFDTLKGMYSFSTTDCKPIVIAVITHSRFMRKYLTEMGVKGPSPRNVATVRQRFLVKEDGSFCRATQNEKHLNVPEAVGEILYIGIERPKTRKELIEDGGIANCKLASRLLK
jgi:hypothetical protein